MRVGPHRVQGDRRDDGGSAPLPVRYAVAMPATSASRTRIPQLVACAGTVALGLASRRHGAPDLIVAYAGDTLYAVMWFFLFGLVRPDARRTGLAGAALAVCFAIEASQAWHPPWLDALRAHALVALVLGRGFLWSDLLCYTVGVGLAGAGERLAGRGR